MTSSIQLFVVLCFTLLPQVIGHSYLTSPISRSNQAQGQTGCRGPQCFGPCDIPLSKTTRAPLVAQRGQNIVVEWPRNNHAGGFIRFAWAPTSQSDDHAAFDAHVQLITCHEIGNPTPGQCAPSDPINDPNGGGSGPGDGSSGACNTVITVPLDLTDGKWTLQWAWFGGAFSLGDYYSCVDYVISGGAVGTLVPQFKGGDFTYPNENKCKFFNTDKLHVCTNEPCQAPIYPAGAKAGQPALGQLGTGLVSPSQVPIPPVSVPVVLSPATSGRVRPVTPVTSGLVRPVTSGLNAPVPAPVTPKPAPTIPIASTTSKAQSTIPAVPISNCASVSTISSSTARITEIDAWQGQFHAVIEINVNENVLTDWVLEVSWPTPLSTHVVRSFNGGTLQCEDQVTSYFKPTASWSNSMPRGSKITVEIIANSDDMTAAQISEGVHLRVLKH